MADIKVRPLGEEYAFGARISGVTRESLEDEAVRQQLRDAFEERGLLIFEDIEPSEKMHVALSDVFGPLKDHPVPNVKRVNQDAMPGVIDMEYDPEAAGVVEIQGKQLGQWLPWHFDHCYNNELNRAGVLRAVEIPEEGGQTGFADGIQLYNDLSPELRERIEREHVIYTLDLHYAHMRFGVPEGFREVRVNPQIWETLKHAKTLPRAIHPAVWTRDRGEKVLHVSPWMAAGIRNHEDPEGDQLLEAVCQEIAEKVKPYYHEWKPTEMLIWDNWRMLHSVCGHPPHLPRRMQRTTILGDYGLGYFEGDAEGDKVLEMTV